MLPVLALPLSRAGDVPQEAVIAILQAAVESKAVFLPALAGEPDETAELTGVGGVEEGTAANSVPDVFVYDMAAVVVEWEVRIDEVVAALDRDLHQIVRDSCGRQARRTNVVAGLFYVPVVKTKSSSTGPVAFPV